MLTREQIELAKRYNAWRRQIDDDDEPRLEMPDPKAIGEAIDALIEHAESGPFTEDGVAIVTGEQYWMGTPHGGDMHVSVFMDQLGLLVQPGGVGRAVPLERFDDPNAPDPSAKLWSSRAAKGGG